MRCMVSDPIVNELEAGPTDDFVLGRDLRGIFMAVLLLEFSSELA